ncbi:hypothetical protein GOP47_0022637 [Adiantum capillus-veneris]|uniref:Uncharacterized protein n=1 Tax=Adiantum capillus-veneris TaxID=13818 RepID=A0A9D4U5Y3_ADICA|nr:hypothetical protein GOP47_0022637 [Adiantum capillus-veneris]
MVVDCRGLIEFCKAFEQYRSMTSSSLAITNGAKQSIHSPNTRSSHRRQVNSTATHLLPSCLSSQPLCERSSAAAVDIIILLLVLCACGFLFTPYFKYLCSEAAEILPLTLMFIGEVAYQVPLAYISGAVITFIGVIVGWELIQCKVRKCDNPKCQGLKKAVEFDIQLESEKCVKLAPSATSFTQAVPWKASIELGEDHKELEAELKRMAPPNGRAVLVFRSPCGCPTARMEV